MEFNLTNWNLLLQMSSLVISVSVVLRIEFSLYAHNKRVTSKNKEKAQTFLSALMLWVCLRKHFISYSPAKQHDNILANKTYLSYYDG